MRTLIFCQCCLQSCLQCCNVAHLRAQRGWVSSFQSLFLRFGERRLPILGRYHRGYLWSYPIPIAYIVVCCIIVCEYNWYQYQSHNDTNTSIGISICMNHHPGMVINFHFGMGINMVVEYYILPHFMQKYSMRLN